MGLPHTTAELSAVCPSRSRETSRLAPLLRKRQWPLPSAVSSKANAIGGVRQGVTNVAHLEPPKNFFVSRYRAKKCGTMRVS
jgi:hypothetical protein